MPAVDRIGDRLRTTTARGERLLVVYLTLGDPLTTSTLDIAFAAVDGGADVLEVGVPTPTTRPRGPEVARSFERARRCPPSRAFELAGTLRAHLTDTPIVVLGYPTTILDLGAEPLLNACREADLDGVVLTEPDGPLSAEDVTAAGLDAIPLIAAGTGRARRRSLERTASRLTYHGLAERTGARLDRALVRRSLEDAAAEATKPFLAGFGIRDAGDIRAIAPHAAGVVVGSELHRGLTATAPEARAEWTRSATRNWKAATLVPRPGTAGSPDAC